MSQPAIVQELWGEPLAVVEGEFHTTGEHEMIAARGDNMNIYVVVFQLQSESAQVSQTIFVRNGHGAGQNIWRLRLVNDGDGVAMPLPAGFAFRLGANKALVLNLTADAQVGYNVIYYVK